MKLRQINEDDYDELDGGDTFDDSMSDYDNACQEMESNGRQIASYLNSINALPRDFFDEESIGLEGDPYWSEEDNVFHFSHDE